MHFPSDLKYTESHEWARLDADDVVTVGITDHAQEALGEIVFIELPELGCKIVAGAHCAVVESVKAGSDIHAPVTGEIVARNQVAIDTPDSINRDAYGVWLFKIQPADAGRCDAELADLLSAAAYTKVAKGA